MNKYQLKHKFIIGIICSLVVCSLALATPNDQQNPSIARSASNDIINSQQPANNSKTTNSSDDNTDNMQKPANDNNRDNSDPRKLQTGNHNTAANNGPSNSDVSDAVTNADNVNKSTNASKATSTSKSTTDNKTSDSSKVASGDDDAIIFDDDATTVSTPAAPDPFENFNRAMFDLNNTVDKYVAKPVAKFLFVTIMPKFLARGIHNFFTNLGTIPTIGNDFLQGKFYQGLSDTWRLTINSTIGLGGFFDPATKMDLPFHNETFNLTLAYWGWKDSTYLVLPVLGPGTVRRALSIAPDWAMTVYYFWLPDNKYTWGLFGLQLLDTRASLLPYEKTLNALMLDPYSFYKDAYLQRQKFIIKQNEQPSTQDIDLDTRKIWGEYGR